MIIVKYLAYSEEHGYLIHMGRLGTLHESQNFNYTIYICFENACMLHVILYIEWKQVG